ncbi:MAG: Gfo/Idh/MocA family oxidoreductase [Trueperaceae bacterium]|nr:Gfo/Idh/MocA family oxidoreductase [Trueperaceae bacterium]
MQDKVRWGVLSTAKIAVSKVVPAMQKADNVDVVAIASRDEAKARRAADALHVPHAFGDYEALLASDEVDAVYNPLPNQLHVSWSKRALEAGKHVLCEKPLGMSADEAAELLDASEKHPHLKVMEGFMYRFHPQWQQAKRWVDEGAIGRLRVVHSHFSYRKHDPDNIRNKPETGGGGLMDIGCYDVSLSRFLFGREPVRVVASVEVDPTFGVDRLASALLDFGDGDTATFTCGTQHEPYQRAQAFGTDGRIELEIPFNAPPQGPHRLWLGRGAETVQTTYDNVDQYTLQGEAFSKAVLEDTPVPTPLLDGVNNMRVLDAIRESAARGGWVSLGA